VRFLPASDSNRLIGEIETVGEENRPLAPSCEANLSTHLRMELFQCNYNVIIMQVSCRKELLSFEYLGMWRIFR